MGEGEGEAAFPVDGCRGRVLARLSIVMVETARAAKKRIKTKTEAERVKEGEMREKGERFATAAQNG